MLIIDILTLLDMAMPMLADSADAAFGLPPLSTQHAADAIIYANDLHNATPSVPWLVPRRMRVC